MFFKRPKDTSELDLGSGIQVNVIILDPQKQVVDTILLDVGADDTKKTITTKMYDKFNIRPEDQEGLGKVTPGEMRLTSDELRKAPPEIVAKSALPVKGVEEPLELSSDDKLVLHVSDAAAKSYRETRGLRGEEIKPSSPRP